MVEICEVVDAPMEMKQEGNSAFKKGQFARACELYTAGFEATTIDDADMRSVFLYNRACCEFNLSKFEKCVTDCSSALSYNPKYCKALFRRALAQEKLEKYSESADDLEKLFEQEPELRVAHVAEYERIVKQRDQKLEREKAEMMKELKTVGNSFLGHFGMSVDDFKFQKDPNTGSYSVSFSKNSSD